MKFSRENKPLYYLFLRFKFQWANNSTWRSIRLTLYDSVCVFSPQVARPTSSLSAWTLSCALLSPWWPSILKYRNVSLKSDLQIVRDCNRLVLNYTLAVSNKRTETRLRGIISFSFVWFPSASSLSSCLWPSEPKSKLAYLIMLSVLRIKNNTNHRNCWRSQSISASCRILGFFLFYSHLPLCWHVAYKISPKHRSIFSLVQPSFSRKFHTYGKLLFLTMWLCILLFSFEQRLFFFFLKRRKKT